MSLVKAERDAIESLLSIPIPLVKVSWPDIQAHLFHTLTFWLYDEPRKAVDLLLMGVSKPRSRGLQEHIAVLRRRERNSWCPTTLQEIEEFKLCSRAVLLRPTNAAERKLHCGLQDAVVLLEPCSTRPHSRIVDFVETAHVACFTRTIC